MEMPIGTNCVQPKVAVLRMIVLVGFLDCLACIAAAKLDPMLGLEGLSVQTEIVHLGLH